jgi:uncharacterized protein YegL
MQTMPNSTLEQVVGFAENSEPRCPCVIVVDSSASMEGEPIRQLNTGLLQFKQELEQDDLASKRVEVAVVSFNSVATVERDFVTIDQFDPPTLTAGGCTEMGAGIEKALDLIEDRKAVYRTNGVAYYRPWLFLFTDGEPTDDVSRAAQRIHEAETNRKVACFAVGVEGANMPRLGEVMVRPPVKLNGLDFKGVFQWLSASMKKVAESHVDEQVGLPAVGWGKI